MGSTHTFQLDELLRSATGTNGGDGKLLLTRLHSEIKYRLSNGSSDSQFFVEAGRVLTKIRGTSNAEARMLCLFDCARYFYGNAHGSAALDLLRHIDLLATQTNNTVWSRKANTFLGVIFADAGNIAAAVPLYSKAFDLARRLSDPFAETVVLINLGVALNYGGLYREAIPCFKRAVTIASSDNDWDLTSPALTNLAQSYLHLGEFEEGLVAIRESLACGREPTDAISATARAVREFTFVQLALELQKPQDAREHAAACLRYGRASGGARGKLLADIALAQCEIEDGNADAGLKALEQLLAACGESSVKTDVLVALIRAYDQIEQPEKSLSHLNALMSFVRTSRETGIAALLASSSALLPARSFATEAHDLSSLRFREARLRAKVAERKAYSCEIEMLERFAVTADLRDDISGEHGYRVGSLAGLVAAELGWKKDATHALVLGGRLHDIGKIGVPDRILLNSNALKEVERHFICAHTSIGADLLGRNGAGHLRVAEEIARYHHEWWNGEGYPLRLSGNRIPIHARIVALADVFDALTHGRPYAEPWSVERALDEIRSRAGTQFDPELAEIFLALVSRFLTQHCDLDALLGRGASTKPFFQARERIRQMLSAERAAMAPAEGLALH
jgi:putative two-component system response regulator